MATLTPSESQPLLNDSNAPRNLTIATSDLSYAAPASRGRPGALLLRDVTLVVPRRGVLPVMGPSGSGKSTLLEVLSGRRRGGFASGEALFGGWPLSAHRRGTVAFAPQDCADLLDGGLTARETLDFAAALRMLGARTAARAAQVDRVLDALELSRCAASRCAVLSGGELRRVSIGEELVGSPAVLLCDEPTTGLDSATALSALRVLAGLPAARDVTVAFSLHQPPYDAEVWLRVGRSAPTRVAATTFATAALGYERFDRGARVAGPNANVFDRTATCA